MHLANAQRLMQAALHRRSMAPSTDITAPKVGPFDDDIDLDPTDELFVPDGPADIRAWDDPCIQCGGLATNRHTDMVTRAMSHWCDDCWDHWWMYRTYLPQIRDGEIHDVSDLLVNVNDQLLGWPD